MNIPFLNLQPGHESLKDALISACAGVIDSNWFILGQRVREFEENYAKFNDVKYAVGVSNGLDALFLALKTLGIGEGDEVIVPSNTYIATALAVMHAGATPVFAEPDEATCNILPANIERVITPKTRAIMPVHLYGQACEMEAICAIAARHQLHIIEDNAQAHGATYKGIKTGAWGILNATSFYPGKNLGALGDAGALTTNNEMLARTARQWSNYGSETKYYHEVAGYNMRMDEMQAALLNVKLQHLMQWTSQRKAIADAYDQGLAGTGDMILPYTHHDATHVYHLYVVRTNRRDELQKWLADHGIGTLIHYPVPPHLQNALAHHGYKNGSYPIAEKMAVTSLSLPVWPGMKDTETAYIIDTIRKFYA
jgi:dTDP-4-amino-4,6-dideoxygalactose transaminase